MAACQPAVIAVMLYMCCSIQPVVCVAVGVVTVCCTIRVSVSSITGVLVRLSLTACSMCVDDSAL